jgi:glutathione S-transferase
MTSLILHHYPQSPVAHKVRMALGIAGASWQSVEIPRLPPKPLLVPLTAGYRRTPVLQVGADIYCDSQNIAHAIDRDVENGGRHYGHCFNDWHFYDFDIVIQ